MTSKAYSAVAVALLVLVAGCAGAPGGFSSDATPTPSDSQSPTNQDSKTSSSGTINFYISDEKNAIGDFAHLNVTITKVGFHLVNESNTSDANETTAANPTTTTAANQTTTPNATTTEAESEADEEAESDESEDDDGDGRWVERDVDNVTIDLTQYQGANATLLEQFDVPNGTYNKVFVYIGEITGTLNGSGEQVNVKLPSERLHINKQFTVGNNESVDFVFDITVFKAGKSGKYILKPVVSQSGTDVPIEADDEADESDENDADDEESEAAELQAMIQGPVTAGESATLSVTSAGNPVANASVTVNGDSVGMTGPNGTIEFTVPSDAEELEIQVTKGEMEAELERDLADGGQPDEEQTTTATSA